MRDANTMKVHVGQDHICSGNDVGGLAATHTQAEQYYMNITQTHTFHVGGDSVLLTLLLALRTGH